jgi:hypothetical protein
MELCAVSLGGDGGRLLPTGRGGVQAARQRAVAGVAAQEFGQLGEGVSGRCRPVGQRRKHRTAAVFRRGSAPTNGGAGGDVPLLDLGVDGVDSSLAGRGQALLVPRVVIARRVQFGE